MMLAFSSTLNYALQLPPRDAEHFIFLRMIMNYTPLSDKVIIERIEGEKTTSTGIILKRADEVDRAKILAIGPDVDEVQVGDVVLLNWNAAIKVEGELYSTKVENIVFIYGE